MVEVTETIIQNEKSRMKENKEFEEFWKKFTRTLTEEHTIRNWTVDKGYLGKGDFVAKSKASGYIECDSPEAEMIQKVPKQDLKMMYEYWNSYINGNMGRADLRDKSRFTKYTISIIHQYEELM